MNNTHKPQDQELIVLLDEQGNPIGSAPKLATHHSATPLHFGFSCYVFNPKGQFLLTRRALSKKTWPGIWTNSCCGHPMPGEPHENAVKRRLLHELQLATTKLELILPDYRYRAEMNGVVENEICPVYIALVDTEPIANITEVEDYKWVAWSHFLAQLAQEPAAFSPWCHEQARLLDPKLKTKYKL